MFRVLSKLICETKTVNHSEYGFFGFVQLDWRLTDQERAQENSSSSSEVDRTPNGVSEDIVKCLCSIFVRISTFKDNTAESRTMQGKKEKELSDPYVMYPETEKRDVGSYKNLCEIKSCNVDLNRTKNAVFLMHRLK